MCDTGPQRAPAGAILLDLCPRTCNPSATGVALHSRLHASTAMFRAENTKTTTMDCTCAVITRKHVQSATWSCARQGDAAQQMQQQPGQQSAVLSTAPASAMHSQPMQQQQAARRHKCRQDTACAEACTPPECQPCWCRRCWSVEWHLLHAQAFNKCIELM